MSYQEVLSAAKMLTTDDQMRLVDSLRATFHASQTVDGLTASQLDAVRRRVEAHAADSASAIPWSVVEQRIEKRLQGLGE